MSKRLAIILLSVGIAALIGVLIWAIGPWGTWGWNLVWPFGSLSRDARSEVEHVEVNADTVDSLDASFVSEDIVIQKSDSDQITVRQYSREDLPEEYRMRVRTDGRQLIVEAGTYSNSIMVARSVPYSQIVVELPKKLASSLSASTVSGELAISDVEARGIDVNSTSGTIRTENVDSESLDLATTSGDITVFDSVCNALTASSISGGIHLDQSEAKDIDCSSTSGDIAVDGAYEQIETGTTSGDVHATLRAPVGVAASTTSGTVYVSADDASALKRVTAGTMSGEVMLALPSGTPISIDFDSLSGSMHTAEGITSVAGGQSVQIEVSTTSGDLSIDTI